MGRRNRYIEIVSLAIIMILFFGNYSNGDYLGYARRYYAGTLFNEFEGGYSLIGSALNYFGVHYNFFVTVIALPAIFLICIITKKYTRSLHVFFVLWPGILLFYDIDQIRNFIVSVFLIFGVYCLCKHNKIGFVIAMLLASLFHKIAISLK